MKLDWTQELPVKEGWYFWKRTRTDMDSWKFKPYYFSEELGEFWEDGTNVTPPQTGWWARIELNEET